MKNLMIFFDVSCINKFSSNTYPEKYTTTFPHISHVFVMCVKYEKFNDFYGFDSISKFSPNTKFCFYCDGTTTYNKSHFYILHISPRNGDSCL